MSKLYAHNDYQNALNNFSNSSSIGRWSLFKDVHMEVSKKRCPICEYQFDENNLIRRDNKLGENLLVPTVDHYRPQEFYSFLTYEHKNYLLMCFECNSSYKKSKFPLYQSVIRATNHNELTDEKPLIVNPIIDDVYELFTLVFKQTSSGRKILELKPKESSGYLHDKALETIKVFGLGNCEVYRHSNENIHNCRIEVLVSHFGKFYAIAKTMNSVKKEELKERLQNSSGFLQFIYREQFEIID